MIGDPALAAAMFLGRGGARLVGGDPGGSGDLEAGIAAAEAAGWGWLARLGRSLLAQVISDATAPVATEDGSDAWSDALGTLLRAWLRPDEPAAFDALTGAATRARWPRLARP